MFSEWFYLQVSRRQVNMPDSGTNSTEIEQKGTLYAEIDLKKGMCFICKILQEFCNYFKK